MKKLRSELARLKGLYKKSEERCQRLQTGQNKTQDEITSKEKETAKLKKMIKELQEQLKAKDVELEQSAVRLEKIDKELVDAHSTKRHLEDTHGELKIRLRHLEAELGKADGVLLRRTEKLLGITAVPERSEEEIRKLRDGLQQQVKQKSRPQHWSMALYLLDDKRQELLEAMAHLEILEGKVRSMQQDYVKAKAKLQKGIEQRKIAVAVSSQQGFKVELCTFFQQGCCAKGSTCTFAHGEVDLAKPARQSSDKGETEARRLVQEFEDLSQAVAQAKKSTRELEVEVSSLEKDHDLHQYKDSLDASEDVLRMLQEEDFASKLFSPGVPTKEDRSDIRSDSHLFRFVKGLMIRSLTHSRRYHHSNEWCQLAQYDIICIKKCINPELSTRYKYEQMKLAQKHPDGVKLPDSLHALELDSKVGELALFHGCRQEVVPQILKQGFDFRIAGTNAGKMFGRGAYFAEQLGRDIRSANSSRHG